MECMELMEHLAFLVLVIYVLYPCFEPVVVFRELCMFKPLDKFTKLGDDRSDLMTWRCIEKLAKCAEDESLTNHGCTRILRPCFSVG